MNIKKVIFVIFLFLSTLNNSYSIEADIFVQSTVNRASKVLSENISKEEKIDKLKIIAKETVDIKGVGLYSLGSSRKNLDDDQLKKYHNLFEINLIRLNYKSKVTKLKYLLLVMALLQRNYLSKMAVD